MTWKPGDEGPVADEDLMVLARFIANSQVRARASLRDHRSECFDVAVLAVAEARAKWSEAKGVPFAAYATILARYRILDHQRTVSTLTRGQLTRGDEARPIQTPCSLDEPDLVGLARQVRDPLIDPEFTAVENRVDLAPLLAVLSPRQRDIIERFFFGEEYLHEIAEDMRITESRVCQLKKVALEKMRAAAEDRASSVAA